MIDDLERSLRELGAHLEFPATPDLAAGVRHRLGEPPRPGRLLTRWRIALALLLAALLVGLGVPQVRTAIAHWLGIGGVVITPVQTLPPLPSASSQSPGQGIGSGLHLGTPSSLAAAGQTAGFPVAVPATLGDPDAVYLRSDLGPTVSLAYAPRAGLPGSGQSGVGLLITEFRAGIRPELVQKFVGPEATVVSVTVAGGMGFWIGGRVHELGFELPNGDFASDTIRLVGPTLIFERGQVTIRIEGARDQTQALAIANSLR